MKNKTMYINYDDVPVFRRQWCFWLLYFIFQPAAIIILLTGDVYYPKKGKIRSFGMTNRVVAGIIGILIIMRIIREFTG